MRRTASIAFLIMTLLQGGISYLHTMNACGDSCSDAAQSRECMCRTYTFAFTVVAPWTFMNATTGDVYGTVVDLARKVCDTAGKLCKFAAVDITDCWNGEFSKVLDGRWYDVCYHVTKDPQSMAKYDFAKYPLAKIQNHSIYVRQGSNITEETLKHPNDFRLAIPQNGEGITQAILDTYYNDGYFVKAKNVTIVNGHIDSISKKFVAALDCGQLDGHSIDIVLMNADVLTQGSNLTFITELNFSLGFTYMKVRKDDQCLLRWYDEAYKNFVCSDEYPTFCQQLPATPVDDHDYCQIREEICN